MRRKKLFYWVCAATMLLSTSAAHAVDMSFRLSLKQPGNEAVTYQLTRQGDELKASKELPLKMRCLTTDDHGDLCLSIQIQAQERVYFNLGVSVATDYLTDDCDFYLPGFWYHKNLRSPREAPSFHTSKSWNFREDRLSSPLTGVYDSRTGRTLTVLRCADQRPDALTTHQEGEVILGGPTSVGYLGFDNESGRAALTFGYPWVETPKRYIRKLTLAEPATTFAQLDAGKVDLLVWLIHEGEAKDYGQFVADTWKQCMDRFKPQPLEPLYTPDEVKARLADYFRKAYVDQYDLKYFSGLGLRCDDCKPVDHVQLGFCGRVLLNAFNALEYGEQHGDAHLARIGRSVYDSWLQLGFTARGYFKEDFHVSQGLPADKDVVHSIRQQSEAVYAVLHYLAYEKRQGRRHPEWEQKMRTLLDQMVALQKSDGHFPRKYRDDHSDVDASGGVNSLIGVSGIWG